MMEHLSTLFYRLLMHSSICILEEFNLFLFIYFIVLLKSEWLRFKRKKKIFMRNGRMELGLPGQIEQEMCINFAHLYLRNG